MRPRKRRQAAPIIDSTLLKGSAVAGRTVELHIRASDRRAPVTGLVVGFGSGESGYGLSNCLPPDYRGRPFGPVTSAGQEGHAGRAARLLHDREALGGGQRVLGRLHARQRLDGPEHPGAGGPPGSAAAADHHHSPGHGAGRLAGAQPAGSGRAAQGRGERGPARRGRRGPPGPAAGQPAPAAGAALRAGGATAADPPVHPDPARHPAQAARHAAEGHRQPPAAAAAGTASAGTRTPVPRSARPRRRCCAC